MKKDKRNSAEERKKVYVTPEGKIVETPPEEKSKSKYQKPIRLNKYGELAEDFTTKASKVMGETDAGEKLYVENGKTYLDYRTHTQNQKRIAVRQSFLGQIVNDYMNYLSGEKKIDLPQVDSSDVIILEGKLPEIVKVGKTKEYGGKCETITVIEDGKEIRKYIVVIDKRLNDKEKITTLYHELVHARGIYDDTETQLEAIHGLREMLKSYQELLEDEDSQEKYFGSGHDPDVLEGEGHKKGTIRGAVNYAISSKGSFDLSYKDIAKKFRGTKRAGATGKLEKIVGAVLAIILSILFAYSILTPKLTGFVILDYGIESLVGALLVISLAFFLIKWTLKHHNKTERG